MSSSSLYQSAILEEPSSSSTTTHVRLTSERPFTPEFVQHNLRTTHSKTRTQTLYEERIRRRQLVLSRKPPPKVPVRAKKQVQHANDDDGRMGRREAAEKGLWRLLPSEAKWELWVPLHQLWCAYVAEMLGTDIAPAAKLVKADFHGSIVTVRRSRNPALVGAGGIVVLETENTFKVVTRQDKLKVLPKQGSVFVFAVPHHTTATGTTTTRTVLDGPHVEFELYGNQFCFRAADRAGRKFKHKESIEL